MSSLGVEVTFQTIGEGGEVLLFECNADRIEVACEAIDVSGASAGRSVGCGNDDSGGFDGAERGGFIDDITDECPRAEGVLERWDAVFDVTSLELFDGFGLGDADLFEQIGGIEERGADEGAGWRGDHLEFEDAGGVGGRLVEEGGIDG